MGNKGKFISLVFLFMLILSFASASQSVTLEKEWKGYQIHSVTGNESIIFGKEGVAIKDNEIILTPKASDSVVSDKQTYKVPDSVPLWKDKKILKWATKDLTDKYIFPLDFRVADFKIGLESILLLGVTSYNAIFDNVAEGSTDLEATRLNLSDDTIIGFWDFEEGSGGVTYDFTKNDFDASITNAVYTTDSKLGDYAMNFDGDGDYATVTDFTNINQTMTAVYWIYRNDTETTDRLFDYNDNGGWIIRGGGSVYSYTGSTLDSQKVPSPMVPTGSWTHVAIVFNETSLKWYYDGVLEDSDTIVALNSTADGNLRIGARTSTGSEAFNGSLDYVKIYNRALSPSEISNLYNEQASLFESTGTMTFNNVDLSDIVNASTSSRFISISLDRCATNLGSSLKIQLNEETEEAFSGCSIGAYNIEDIVDTSAVNVTLTFTGATNNYYTPMVFGNITFSGLASSTIDSLYPNNLDSTIEEEKPVFKQNSIQNYRFVCIDENGNSCANSTEIYIYVTAPNGTQVVTRGEMNSQGDYFNYTLPTNNLGTYKVLWLASAITLERAKWEYEVTPSGNPNISEGQGLTILGSLVTMLLLGLLFIFVAFKFENYAVKIMWSGIGGILLFSSILYSVLLLAQNLGAYDAIVDSYSTFLFIMRFVVSIGILALLLFAGLKALELWKFKRGFED